MNKLTITASLLASVLAFAPLAANSQESTEVYIPIGASPGVSVDHSLRGEISSLDYASRTIVVRDRRGEKTVHVGDATLYYLDRSGNREKNATGTMEDCKVGRVIEVYVADNGDVKWIKIAVD